MNQRIVYRGHIITGTTYQTVQHFTGGSGVAEVDEVRIDGVKVSQLIPFVGGLDKQVEYAKTIVDQHIADQERPENPETLL